MARVWQRKQQRPGASLQRAGNHSSPSQNDESQAQSSFLLKRKPLNIQHNRQGGSMGTVQALTHAPATGGSTPQPQLMLALPDSACPGPSPWPAGWGCVRVTRPGCRNASAQTVSRESQLDLRFLPSEDSSPGHLRTNQPRPPLLHPPAAPTTRHRHWDRSVTGGPPPPPSNRASRRPGSAMDSSWARSLKREM